MASFSARSWRRWGVGQSAVQRAVRRGELVRLRRGAYCEAQQWRESTSWQRHVLLARAVAAGTSRPIVFAGASLAALWGIPHLGGWPQRVEVLAPPARGGRSKGDVRRRVGRCDAPVEREGLLVTPLAHTAVVFALELDFAPAVGALDWALWRRNPERLGRDALTAALEQTAPRYGRAYAEALIGFASPLADSFGESLTRANIHLLGYPAPEPQTVFADEQGEMEVDLYFRAARTALEFDGKVKYTRAELLAGREPAEVVWKEKLREDRLRRQPLVRTVARVIWPEAVCLSRLDAVLRSAGLAPETGPPVGAASASARRARRRLDAPVVAGAGRR